MQVNAEHLEALPENLQKYSRIFPELLINAKAENTVKKYIYGFCRWKKWASKNKLTVFPVESLHLCLYCSYLLQNDTTSSALSDIFYSIRWAHNTVGVVSPTESLLVRNIFEGAKRRVVKPTVKKEIMTIDILNRMYNANYNPEDLQAQRIITISLLCFAGFFRSAEVLNLTRSDIRLFSTHMELFIEQSKTDIYRDGSWVLIARTDGKLCPVQNLKLYLNLAHILEDSDEFLFRNITKCKAGYILRKENKPLAYNRLRESFVNSYSSVVSDISKFGLHSFRAGGASAAAACGVSDRLFKRHGRWRSETAKDGYVKDSTQERLSVSTKLGL